VRWNLGNARIARTGRERTKDRLKENKDRVAYVNLWEYFQGGKCGHSLLNV